MHAGLGGTIMLVTDDSVDAFHPWDAADPHWIETFWFGAWIPEDRISVYVYQWFRPVLGIYGGGCFVWDATSHHSYDIPFYSYDTNRPLAGPVDLRDLSLDNGTTLKTIEDGESYAIGFRRGDVALDLRFDATTPAEVVGPEGVTAFFKGHIDQSGHYTGRLRLGGRDLAIDCHGIRDRSWGPRVITDDIRMNYCHGQSATLAFVAYSRPEADGVRTFKGSISMDGRTLDIAEGSRRSHFANGKLDRIEIALTDTAGRRIEGVGRPLNTLVHEPYPGMVNWLHLVEWRLGDAIVYGEEQDVWSMALWRRRDRRQRG